MSVRTDEVQLRVTIVSDKAKRELSILDQEAYQLREQMKGLRKNTNEYVAASAKLKEVENKMAALRKQAGLNALTLKQLNQEASRLRLMRDHITPGTAAFRENEQQLQAVQRRILAVRSGMGPFAAAWKQVSIEAKGALAVMSAAALYTNLKNLVTGTIELDEALVDVRKVTGLAGEELQKLNTELGKIDTQTAKSDLLELAYEAGKLGNNSVEDVLAFVRAADQIKVALGKDLGEGATREIGKLVSIFKLKEEFGLEKGMLKIGSAINEVGMASTASEGYLVEFAKRMSGVVGVAKISAPEIMGLAGTLDSLGQTAEVSSTALSKLLTKMGGKMEVFAKMAKMSLGDFRALMNESGLSALLKVIEEMGKSSGGLEDLAAQLGDIGLDGGRVVGVLGTLSKNMDEVKRQTQLANKAFQEGTSITNEFALKNESMGAKVKKAWKEVLKAIYTPKMKEAVNSLIDGFVNLVNYLKNNFGTIKTVAKLVGLMVTAWAAYRVIALAALIPARLKTIALNLQTAALLRAQQAEAAFIVMTARSTTATHMFNAAMKATPWGLVLTMITTAVAAFAMFRKEQQENSKRLSIHKEIQDKYNQSLNEEVARMNLLFESLRKTNPGSKERSELIRKINENYGTHLKNISDEVAFNKQLVESYENLVNLKMREAALNAQNDIVTKHMERIIGYKKLLISLEENLKNAEVERITATSTGYMGNSPEEAKANQLKARISGIKAAIEEEQNLIREIYDQTNKVVADLKIEDNIKPYEGGGDETKKKAKIAELVNYQASEYERLAAELKKIRQSMFNDLLSDNDKELIAAAEKYKALLDANEESIWKLRQLESQGNQEAIRQIKIHEDQRIEIYKLRDKELEEITRRQEQQREKEIADAEEKIREGLMTELERKVNAVAKHYDELIELAKKYGLDITQLEQAKEDAIAKINKDAKEAIEKEHKESLMKTVQKYVSAIQTLGSGIESALNSFSRLAMERSNKELELFKANYDARMTKLEEYHQAGLINEETYAKQKEKLQKEMMEKERAIKKAAWEKQREADLITAAIRMSLAILGGLMTQPFWPNGVAAGAAAAIAGGAELAFIAGQPTPTFGGGGFLGDGPSHDSYYGGMPIINPSTGKVMAMVEGQEAILSKKTVEKNPGIVSALVEAGQKHDGDLKSIYNTRGANFSPKFLSKAMDTTAYARSGFYSKGTTTTTAKTASATLSNSTLEKKMDKLIEVTSKKNENLHATVSIQELKERQDLYSKIQRISKI